ncbi:hypothetical protein H5410_000067, partial [Solanum commersonii]
MTISLNCFPEFENKKSKYTDRKDYELLQICLSIQCTNQFFVAPLVFALLKQEQNADIRVVQSAVVSESPQSRKEFAPTNSNLLELSAQGLGNDSLLLPIASDSCSEE